MPWPSSAVNSGPRRLSQAHGITETRRNSQPTCSAASCSSPADHPDVQSQAWSVFEKFSRRLDALAAPEHGTNGRQFSARNERGQRERNGTECRRFRGDESQFRVENDVYTERVGGSIPSPPTR